MVRTGQPNEDGQAGPELREPENLFTPGLAPTWGSCRRTAPHPLRHLPRRIAEGARTRVVPARVDQKDYRRTTPQGQRKKEALNRLWRIGI